MGGWGMKGVDTIARVRREHFVRGKTIKEIVRELHVSRNTVRKILRSGATEFEYERTVQPRPRLGPWREQLERLLAANAARPRRERLTLMRLFEELRGLGYAGGYDAVRRYAASWRRRQNAATAARGDGGGVRAAELRARRGLPVRLEPRDRRDQWRDDDRESGAPTAVP